MDLFSSFGMLQRKVGLGGRVYGRGAKGEGLSACRVDGLNLGDIWADREEGARRETLFQGRL